MSDDELDAMLERIIAASLASIVVEAMIAGHAVASVLEDEHGNFEAWCIECDRLLAVGPSFPAMRDWARTHRKLVHGDIDDELEGHDV